MTMGMVVVMMMAVVVVGSGVVSVRILDMPRGGGQGVVDAGSGPPLD